MTRAVEEEDEASDDETNDSGSTLLLTNETALCPLTGEPPRDPVYVRDTGIIYSQAALLARCEKVGVLHCPESTRASGQTVLLNEESIIPLDLIATCSTPGEFTIDSLGSFCPSKKPPDREARELLLQIQVLNQAEPTPV